MPAANVLAATGTTWLATFTAPDRVEDVLPSTGPSQFDKRYQWLPVNPLTAPGTAYRTATSTAPARVAHVSLSTVTQAIPKLRPKAAREHVLERALVRGRPARRYGFGQYGYGLYSYGLYRYGLYSYGLYSYGLGT